MPDQPTISILDEDRQPGVLPFPVITLPERQDEQRSGEFGEPILAAVAEINRLLLAAEAREQILTEVACLMASTFNYSLVAVGLLSGDARSISRAGVSDRRLHALLHRHSRGARRSGHSVPYQWTPTSLEGTPAWAQPVLDGRLSFTTNPGELLVPILPLPRAEGLARAMGAISGVIVPLPIESRFLRHGNPVGAMICWSPRGQLAQSEQKDLVFLAKHIAPVLEVWRLHNQAETRTALLSKLHTLSRTIASTLELGKLYEEVAVAAGKLADIDYCAVSTLSDDRHSYENQAVWGIGDRQELLPGPRTVDVLPPELIRRALVGEMAFLPNVGEFPLAEEALRARKVASIALFPFKSDDRVVGCITVGREEAGELLASDVEILKQLSDYVTIAFTNASLYSEAQRRAERMTTLHKASERIARLREPSLLFEELSDALERGVDAPLFEIVLYSEERARWEVVLSNEDGVQRSTPYVWEPLSESDPTSRAISSGQTCYIPDLLSRAAADGKGPLGEPCVRSTLSVPLIADQRTVGAITAKSYAPSAYGVDDVQTVQILATQAAISLRNIMLLEEEARTAVEQAALAESARAIARLDVTTVLNTIVSRASEIVKSSRCTLLLFDEKADELYWAAGYNNSSAVQSLRLPATLGVVGRVFSSGEPIVVNNLREDPRSMPLETQGIDPSEEPVSFIGVPLKGPNGNIGVLVTAHSEPGVFTRHDMEILCTFADYATIALANARLYTSLQQREAERSQLLHQMLTSQEAERRRISADIHDGPLQTMGVSLLAIDRLRKLLSAGDSEKAVAELEKARRRMAASVQELRDVINDLRPSELEVQGLAPAARSHLSHFSRNYGITATLDDELDEERLPSTLEVIFYRLLQESLTNVRKHAQASAVSVRLWLEDHRKLKMTVTDNGVGFEPSSAVARALANGHIGLHSMWERVDLIGGGMEIDSRPGQGTSITFSAPIVNYTL